MVDAACDTPVQTTAPRRHPRPNDSIPPLAWPTVGLLAGGVGVFALTAVGVVSGHVSVWFTIPVNSVIVFVMFLVAHEALHRTISTRRWVNAVLGRIAWLLVLPQSSLPTLGYVHMEHHRHTNDGANDPDMAATHAPGWQLPIRWAFMDCIYTTWYMRRLPGRLRHSWRQPTAEVMEMAVLSAATWAGLYFAVAAGYLWPIVVLVLIPQRLGFMLIAWWFDWLPHQGLEHTQRSDRYRATRIRVGMEGLLNRIMLGQNYHLIHHLHPWLPFYRYHQAWLDNEDAYLENHAAIATLWGRELSPEEFREWQGRVLEHHKMG